MFAVEDFLANRPTKPTAFTKLVALVFIVEISVKDKINILHRFNALTVRGLTGSQFEQVCSIYDIFEGVDREQPENGVLELKAPLDQMHAMMPSRLLLHECVYDFIHFLVETLFYAFHILGERHA